MMLRYYTHTLANGLQVVVQPTKETKMAIINLMYLVGARNESPENTGMAHFLEHIMFGGSKNVANYDKILQEVGGKNNAYTSNDVTSYWCKVPASQLEVAFWLESDRLLSPAYADKTIETQRQVVIEEFKQCCINKPYGEVWHLLCEQAYEKHPYAWPTIGKTIDHIAKMKKADIIDFGNCHYVPNNAVLVVVGDVDSEEVFKLAEKWFGPIPKKQVAKGTLPQEVAQQAAVYKTCVGNVPQDVLYKTYHIPGRMDDSYKQLSLLSEFLSGGESSLLYQKLVEEKAIFSDVEASTTSTMDPGLFIIEGKLPPGISFEKAEVALQELLDSTITRGIEAKELQKIKNQEDSSHLWTLANLNSYADLLAYASLLGDTSFFEKERMASQQVTSEEIQATAAKTFCLENSHTLYYEKKAVL